MTNAYDIIMVITQDNILAKLRKMKENKSPVDGISPTMLKMRKEIAEELCHSSGKWQISYQSSKRETDVNEKIIGQ